MVFEIVANPKMDNPMKGIEIKIAMIENTINEITEHFEGFRPDRMPSAPHITKRIAHHIPIPRYEIPLYCSLYFAAPYKIRIQHFNLSTSG